MGLSSALGTALSGLRTTQAAIDVVSQNVANANSVGYTKRRLDAVQQVAGDQTVGVRNAGVSGCSTSCCSASFAWNRRRRLYRRQGRLPQDLDQMFGPPGGVSALDTAVNGLTQSFQALANDPSAYSTRSAVLAAASGLASRSPASPTTSRPCAPMPKLRSPPPPTMPTTLVRHRRGQRQDRRQVRR